MAKRHLNNVTKSAYTCDHCSKRVTVLWRDNQGWLLCPKCYPLYHAVSDTAQRDIDAYLATL